LLAAGQVGPMILVFPGISSDNNAVSGMLTNFKSPELTTAAGIGNGKFKDYFLNDVIPYVDANYRTVANKSGRGVDGFSLGGYMAVKIAAQHPELFRTVGAFDGTHFFSRVSCQEIDPVDQTFLNAMFDPVFGNPRDYAYGALNNGPSLVCNSTPDAMKSMRWFIQHGPATGEPNDANFLRGDHLIQKLTEKGVVNELPAVLEGGHNWETADEHMRQSLPLHWSVLAPVEMGAITRAESGHLTLQGTGVPSAEHSIDASSDLAESFQPLATVLADANGKLVFKDEDAPNHARRFYRFSRP
ncbi:MAG TPA: alpha/beta hydrolase-fold protein, partial [Chthoniobacterales bacterium]|nr:alpha/beta hydrolase-fold protein [Chthoniobacterales bacterium]